MVFYHYQFDYDLTLGGVPYATAHGVARITGKGEDWHVASIRLDATHGHKKVELPRDHPLHPAIELWLITERGDDVDAEWSQHLARTSKLETV